MRCRTCFWGLVSAVLTGSLSCSQQSDGWGRGNRLSHTSHSVGQYSFSVNKSCVRAVTGCRGECSSVALFIFNFALGEISG